ncbi:MAG: cytochrome c biogenesis protein CcsA [Pseudomonadota bacterium]
MQSLFLSLSALMAMIPMALLAIRRRLDRSDELFWAVLAVAILGPATYCSVILSGNWSAGFAAALWLSIATTLAFFAALVIWKPWAVRLTVLLVPYLFVLALLALFFSTEAPRDQNTARLGAWLVVHIILSVVSYALVTLAAVAGGAVFWQERALKAKRQDALTSRLPAMAQAESMQVKLLLCAEGVLGLSIASGMAQLYQSQAHLISLDHKTLLAIMAFAVIGVLLVLHHNSGLRGRRAARLVLLGYLLLSLAYPGVKFVTDVLLGHN